MNRAISVTDILNYKPKVMNFEGEWFDSFGAPELKGCWIVFGLSGNGKTAFTLKLCKYLTRFGKIAYNSLEEGLSLSFQKAIKRVNMIEVGQRFILLNKEPIQQLIERLQKRRSPDIIVIDSVQYSGLNKDTAKALIDRFPSKLFIFISHGEGSRPAGRTASAIFYHSDIKLRVEGYRIPSPISRFKEGDCLPFVIWKQGSDRYWGGGISKSN